MKDGISHSQLRTLCFVAMLSPFLRLLPASVAAHAGSAAWVSAALSIVPALLLAAMLTALTDGFPQGRGLSHSLPCILGNFLGKSLLLVWSAWLIFHSGFLLRSGAARFISTIYPTAKPAFFIAVTAAICAVAAVGHVKPLARCAELFRPLLLFVILLVPMFSLSHVEPTFLLPVTMDHAEGILKGIPLAAESVSVALVCMGFLQGYTKPQGRPTRLLLWLVGVTVLNVLLCGISVGCLGKTYTSALSYPFFIMARDLSIVSGVERIEALVVGLWLLPDFILITLELILATDNLHQIFPLPNGQGTARVTVGLGALAAAVIAFRIDPQGLSLKLWSYEIIPAIHLAWAYAVIPLLFAVAHLRKRF